MKQRNVQMYHSTFTVLYQNITFTRQKKISQLGNYHIVACINYFTLANLLLCAR